MAMSEETKEVRERIVMIRAAVYNVGYVGSLNTLFLCDQLSRALDRIEALELDEKRLDLVEEGLDDMLWHREVGESGLGPPTLVLDWFFGDGDSSARTSGATFREAIDHALALVEMDEEREPMSSAEAH